MLTYLSNILTHDVKKELLDSKKVDQVARIASRIVEAFKIFDGKVLFCGNGGSAADAQHLAAELSGRYYYDRPPLNAEALHVNTSYLTAVANDYSYDEVYSRMVKAVGRKGDVLIGMSTSGNSENVLRALKTAVKKDMYTVALTGAGGGKMAEIVDIAFLAPSTDTPRIQECHMLIGHAICQLVEQEMFPRDV